MRRIQVCYYLLFLFCLAIAVFMMWLVISHPVPAPGSGVAINPIPTWPIISMSVLLIVVVLGGVVYTVFIQRHAKKTAASCSGFACPRCLYDLSADETDRCSECGQRVVHAALPLLWMMGKKEDGCGEFEETGFDKNGRSRVEIRWGRLGMVLWLLFFVGIFFPQWVKLPSGWFGGNRFLSGFLSSAIVMGGLLVIVIFFGLRSRRLLGDALWASGGMACPKCLHDLSGVEVSRCPECGQIVDYATLGKKWAVRMKVMRLGPGSGRGLL